MGWLLTFCSLLFLSIVTSYASSPKTPGGLRNVTADELLEYGVVIHPDSSFEGCVHQSPINECRYSRRDNDKKSGTGFNAATDLLTDTDSGAEAGASADGGLKARTDKAHVSDSDFVFATGTFIKRIRLASASRGWRGSKVRAFFLIDSPTAPHGLNTRRESAGEVYAYFPSEGAPELGGWVRSLRGGDTRVAAAPFAAHRHFGKTYKWMLYGDDDTVFFMDAVKQLVANLDPELPIALSDNLWFSNRHPNPNAPRCLPCHMANETLPSLEEIFMSAPGRVEIRTTYQQRTISKEVYEAFARNTTQVPGERYRPEPVCPGVCTTEAACKPVVDSGSTAPCTPPTAHGGAGMIFSVGLMRSIPFRDALDCFLTFTNATGGDQMVSECLWRHGIAFTDPGPLVRHSYDYQYVIFGGAPRLPSLVGLELSGTEEPCNALCTWMLRNVVSIHMHARIKKDIKALAAQQEAVPKLRQAVLKRLPRQKIARKEEGAAE
ncbi:hypothetical protein VaNZ11_012203 [Volvox africanus]|uniref:Uncharacterized protein n=1 Tax=Volvox africanus TaxID=51714 RepID=A0ABQ5SEA1_9CHLO|nr:hypothetical protein VaNZ11_012203 [Volvox africanus]